MVAPNDEHGQLVRVGRDAGCKACGHGCCARRVPGRGAGVGEGLEDGSVGGDVVHGALILDDGKHRERFVGEPVPGQSKNILMARGVRPSCESHGIFPAIGVGLPPGHH